ncbi:guanyl-specific ribonuclease [Triangularia verruculosa]|uniref:ribonuclease T1 n=1 Tax=Triangularia verruculosa TaxID=2587418 RepID=A0AAN6XJK5_9PEZI|nr:guanyl-specific ribonuclease [Triangularia verruculosa]
MGKLSFSLLILASALPVFSSPLSSRAITAVGGIIRPSNWTCGTHGYASWEASQAAYLGYSLLESSDYNGKYPHEYMNREGFDFDTEPPYYEYPILPDGPYTGGSPGPDRVIFDNDGMLEGLITHTGASGDNFVACSEEEITGAEQH